jgi:hypothetical protein
MLVTTTGAGKEKRKEQPKHTRYKSQSNCTTHKVEIIIFKCNTSKETLHYNPPPNIIVAQRESRREMPNEEASREDEAPLEEWLGKEARQSKE